MDPEDIGPAVEQDWKRVEALLAKGDEASGALAVVEANKVFCWVLDLVSYGQSPDDMIRNAENLFEDVRKVMAAREVYARITEEIGYMPAKKLAKESCEAYMTAILDLIGGDDDPTSFGARLMNSLNYFWGHHPKFLIVIVSGLLAVVGLVVFLADTAVGHWVVRAVVGFSRFVVSVPALLVGLLVSLALAWAFVWLFSVRKGSR